MSVVPVWLLYLCLLYLYVSCTCMSVVSVCELYLYVCCPYISLVPVCLLSLYDCCTCLTVVLVCLLYLFVCSTRSMGSTYLQFFLRLWQAGEQPVSFTLQLLFPKHQGFLLWLEFLNVFLQDYCLGPNNKHVCLLIIKLHEIIGTGILELERCAGSADLSCTRHVTELVELPILPRKLMSCNTVTVYTVAIHWMENFLNYQDNNKCKHLDALNFS